MNTEVITVEAEEIPIELSVQKSFLSSLEKHEITKKALEEKRDECLALKLNGQDKEAYTLIRETRLNQKTNRVVIEKICKKGREDATKTQKAWIGVEKEYVNIVSEGEEYLKKLEDEYEAKQERIKQEAKRKQEEAFIIRQAELTKMGATYQDGSFVLNDVSYEAILIKESDDEVWETMKSKFNEQYLINEEKRIAEEKIKEEAVALLESQRQDQERRQKELEAREAAIKQKEQEEIDRQLKKQQEEEAEKKRVQKELQPNRLAALMPYNPTGADIDMQTLWVLSEGDFNSILAKKRDEFEKEVIRRQEEAAAETERRVKLAEEIATRKEQERVAEENRKAEEKRLQDEAKKVEEALKATDKTKWASVLKSVEAIQLPEMKHPAYKQKVIDAKKLIAKIIDL